MTFMIWQTDSVLTFKKTQMFYFILYVLLYVTFMVILGVVVLPENNSNSFLENHTFVRLIRNVLQSKNSTDNETKVSERLDKIGMPIYIINLNRSKDRWQKITDDLKLILPLPTLYRIEAVDASLITSMKHGSLNGIKYENELDNCTPSELACTLSHLKSIQQAYTNDLPYVLIVEDDAMFSLHSYWKKSLVEIIQDLNLFDPEWSMLLVFSTKVDYKNTEKDFVRTVDYCGTVAYIMNRKGIKTILDKIYNATTDTFMIGKSVSENAIADKLLHTLSGNSYSYRRPLIYTMDTESTIVAGSNKRRDYANCWSAKILKEYIDDIVAT